MGDNVRPGQRLGDAVTAQRLNAIMDAIRGLARGDNLIRGRDIMLRQTADGIVVGVEPGSGRSTTVCPFDISLTVPSVGNLKATFRPGTINGLLPSNYLTGVTFSSASTQYLSLDCTVTNGAIVSAAFVAEGSQPGDITPTLGQPPASFKYLVALVANGTAYKILSCGNIQARPAEAFRLDRVSPTAGQLPYDIYYTWNFTTV
jgi:hypothetical protein